MQTKKLLLVLLCLTLSLMLGCNKTQEKSPSGDLAGKIRVAYIARAQADSFAAWLANSIKEEAKKYPNIIVDIFDGQANDDVENSLIENAIINKYDVIIIQPNNGEAQRPYAEKVVAAGIICLTSNARIAGIAGASSVDADPYKQAAVNAVAALTQIPQGANVVVLNGPPGNFHADERRRSWKIEFFDKRPDVKIVGEQIANWNKDEALSFMETWIQANNRIDAVISMNDNMAAGALEAVKGNPKFNDLLVYGVDGTAEACLLIKEGKMTSTCMQSAYDLSEKILDTVNKLVNKEATQIDTDIDNPLVTKDNVDQYIEMYKKTGAIS